VYVEPGSVDPRSNVALVEGEFAGGTVGPIVVSGGVVSMTHVYEAGLPSVLPALSVARTWKVWLPSARPEYVFGDVQDVKAAPSRLHWKLEPGSVEEKSNVAPVAIVSAAGSDGPMLVSGGVASIVHE
jgi:hypothetical protein